MKPMLGILCYHRIINDAHVNTAWPYFERGTAVRTSTFRSHLASIAEFADIVPESIALNILDGSCRPKRPAIWLTFDDGYRDVLGALSLVASGTVFVTTSSATRPLPADAWYAILLDARRRRGVVDLGSGPVAYDLDERDGRVRLVNGPERRAYLRATPDTQAFTLHSLATQLDAPKTHPDCYLTEADLPRVERALVQKNAMEGR